MQLDAPTQPNVDLVEYCGGNREPIPINRLQSPDRAKLDRLQLRGQVTPTQEDDQPNRMQPLALKDQADLAINLAHHLGA
jgi:hypothetical protein